MDGIVQEHIVTDIIKYEDKKYGEKPPKVRVPRDKYFICHLVFFLLGVCHFLPMTFFAAANNFWMYKFRNSSLADAGDASQRTYLQKNYASASMIASTVPSLIFGILNVTHSHKFKIMSRVLVTVSVQLMIFILITVSVKVDTDKFQVLFFALVLLAYATLAAANTVNMLASMNLYVRFPHEYMKTSLIGEGCAGIVGDLVNVLTVAIFSDDITKATLVYFVAGSSVVALTLILNIVISRTEFFQHCLESVPLDPKKKLPSKSEFIRVLHKVKYPLGIATIALIGIAATHPAITALVVSEKSTATSKWAKNYFSPVMTFLLADVGMLVGRCMSSYLPFKMSEGLFMATAIISRILVPFIWLCNAKPRNHLPIMFPHDYQYGIIWGTFMSINGYIINMTSLYIPQKVEKEDLDAAFTLFGLVFSIMTTVASPMGSFIVLGLHFVAFMLLLATTTVAYRLPTTVHPISYEVHLTLPEEAFTANSDAYEGYELITIRATATVTEIKLHAAHDFINVISAHINNVDITNISIDNNTDIITLAGFTMSANTNATLYIFFTSRLSTQDMYGFYKSSYTVGGQTRYLATTQFQPLFARRAFPCFDEPSFKAVFDIYISNPRGLTALSNMPGEDFDISDIVGNNPNLTTTHFATTGVMSSYLVAIVVSDLTCSSGQNIEITAVPYRVCSTAETNLTRELALDAGVTLLRSLNTYTDYLYSTMGFSKMDQIAIPDFAAGAMENWGLVTYREQLLLWDSVESTNMDQQQIATIISHEYAHQWWGNLVTMQWWSETFLNEGFATYFQYFTTHEVYPSWELDKQWVIRVLQGIMESDSLTSSPALQAPANSDAQVMARFAQVSYLKGGAIFRMAEHILGPDNFKEGLRSYLKKFEFQTTLPDDLWNSLDETLIGTNRSRLPLNTNLRTVMSNWVESPGYPILDLTFVNFAVVVRQEGRFLLNGNDTTSRWYIPITYATNVNPNFENTLAQDWLLPIGFVEIPFLTTHNWIVLNNYATGYYRVNYNTLWDPLIVALQDPAFSGIPDVNRAAFVDDAFHLARADKLNYTRTFDIISFLTNDTSYYPWFRAINGFNFLLRRVGQDSRLGQAMSEHVLDLLANVYASVPWTNLNSSDHIYTLKQIDVLTMACRLGLPNCVQHALERFGDFRISGNRPTQNIRSIVYCNALRNGNNSADWNLLWNAFTTSQLASDRVRILSALGCTNDEEILERYLHLSLDETSGIRSQDALSVFTAVYTGSPKGLDVAFRFLQENHALIDERYASLNALTNMIVGLAGWFTTQAQVVQLRNFISTGGLHEDFQNAANSALATAEANLVWLDKYSEELHRYYGLEMDVPEPSSSSVTPNITSSTEAPLTTAPGDSDGAGAITASILLIVSSIAFALRS